MSKVTLDYNFAVTRADTELVNDNKVGAYFAMTSFKFVLERMSV